MSRIRKYNYEPFIKLIALLLLPYHFFLSPFLKTLLGTKRLCRFTPTCSDYLLLSIRQKGIFAGGSQWFRRFLRCQPFASLSL